MAEGLKAMIEAGEMGLIEGIFQAARKAGHQLVKEDKISEQIQQAVSRELMPEMLITKSPKK
jgi:hypothetical protein